MKRVLFDENLPRLLRRKLPDFEIRTVQEEGWGSFRNADLLRRAEEGNFDVLLTADRRMQYQQKLASFAIGVVVTSPRDFNSNWLEGVTVQLRAAIEEVSPGEVLHVTITP